MADISRLETALRNADAAGDVEAARMLAGEIMRARPQAPSEQSFVSKMFSDVVPEIKQAASENMDAIRNMYGGTAEKGVIQQTLDVGKGLAAIPGLAASPITGAARSLIGHPLAAAIQTAGSYINPEAVKRENPQDVYNEAKAGVDQAMMAAAPRMRPTSPVIPSAGELKQAAVNVYQSPQVKNIQIAPADVQNLSASISNDLIQQGFRPSNGSAPGTFSELQRMTPGQGVGSIAVDDLRAARRALSMTERQRDTFGQATTDATAARQSIQKIDNFLDTLAPELREANANYAAGKRADALDYRTAKAEQRAARTGSGSNIENTMRQEVAKIPDRGLSMEERAARDRVVDGTSTRNALRKLGKLGVSDGLSLMLNAGAAYGTGGMSLPVTAAGTMARKLGEALTRRDIASLNKSIRGRSPLALALAANTGPRQIPKGAKALALALLSHGAERPAFNAVMPGYANQDQK